MQNTKKGFLEGYFYRFFRVLPLKYTRFAPFFTLMIFMVGKKLLRGFPENSCFIEGGLATFEGSYGVFPKEGGETGALACFSTQAGFPLIKESLKIITEGLREHDNYPYKVDQKVLTATQETFDRRTAWRSDFPPRGCSARQESRNSTRAPFCTYAVSVSRESGGKGTLTLETRRIF